MDLKEEILREHSKNQANYIAKWALEKHINFDALMQMFLSNSPILTQRSSYALSKCFDEAPNCIAPYIKELIDFLKKDSHIAVRRNILRFFDSYEIPQEYEGEILNYCFRYLLDKKELPAVKSYALTISAKLCKKYPDLINELKLIVEDHLGFAYPSFKVRVRRVFPGLLRTIR